MGRNLIKKHIVAKILHPLISVYETPMYKPFIKRGLDQILTDVNLKPLNVSDFLGLVQIVVVKNEKFN